MAGAAERKPGLSSRSSHRRAEVAKGLQSSLRGAVTVPDALLLCSYNMLVPGILGSQLMYNSTGLSFKTSFPSLIKDLAKSHDISRRLVGLCIFFWGVCLPLAKLLVYLLFRCGEQAATTNSVMLVQRVAKWSMVDAVIPLLFAGLLAASPNMESSMSSGKTRMSLEPPVYLFLVHLLFCSFAFLLVRPPKSEAMLPLIVEPATLPGINTTEARRWAFGFCIVLCLIVEGALVWLVNSVHVAEMAIPGASIKVHVTIADLVYNNFRIGAHFPALVLLLILVFFPMIDVALGILSLGGLKVHPVLSLWAEHFSMLDVFFAGLVSSSVALPVVDPMTTIKVSPEGYVSAAAAIAWWAYTMTSRRDVERYARSQ